MNTSKITLTVHADDRVLVLDPTEFDYLHALTARAARTDYRGTAEQRLAHKVRAAL